MPNESEFVHELVKYYNNFVHSFFHRTHGGMYSSITGLPDIVGCYRGSFVGIECKCIELPKKDVTIIHFKKLLTPKQIDVLKQIEIAEGISRAVFLVKDHNFIAWFDLKTLETSNILTGDFKNSIILSRILPTQKTFPPQPNNWKEIKKFNKKSLSSC